MKSEEKRSYLPIYLLSVAATALLFILSGYTWLRLSSSESNISGRFLTIFAVPILFTVILGLLPLVARIEPRKLHVAQSHKALTTLWSTWLLFFSVIHTVVLLNILGHRPTIATYWPILAGLVTMVIGNYLGKIRSNYYAGFRTPWTLASELSWNKTHRLGGKLLFLLGILLIAGPILVMGDFWVYFVLAASLLWTVTLVIYSYFVWKRDPDRKDIRPSLTS